MSMKGQISYIMKPLMLISVVILLIFLLQSIYSNRGKEDLVGKNFDIMEAATNILLILSNSDQCLAYTSSITGKTRANIIDINKLNSFEADPYYQDIEPECARNYEFGWRVNVKQINKNNQVEKEWGFGANEFSKGESLNNEVEFWIPVVIRYSENDVKLGKMEIRLVNGELEKLAGFFDWSCKMGQLGRLSTSSTDVMLSQPVNYIDNKLCMGGSCRKLICKLDYFKGFESKGTYSLVTNYKEPDKLVVGK